MSEINEQKEVLEFGAEVGKILKLVINSIYTNRDIFLRELISNASDACDKLRYLSISNPELLSNDPELKIKISYNEEEKTITISDNGIGLNRQDMIENLGTIASSGTQRFMEAMKGEKNVQLIGQFGVGFYSSFMVAHKVVVESKKAGENQAYRWESEGSGQFSIEKCDYNNRGTKITLYINDEDKNFIDHFRLKHIIKTYSDHIAFPIELQNNAGEFKTVNNSTAIWSQEKSEITKEQYQNFYRDLSHMPEDPWLILHNKNEGTISYINLLFIPSQKPFDLFHPDMRQKVRLYINRVFITDEQVSLLPRWLRFMYGVIDSQDLPLNISRETLQQNHVVEKIKNSLIKKILSSLKKICTNDREKYLKFWSNFGAVLKEGLCEHLKNKEELLEICLFETNLSKDPITIEEYMSKMKQEQEKIYYLLGDDINSLKHSPQLEMFNKNDIEVILLSDTVDDFWVNVVHEHKEKQFASVTKSHADLKQYVNESEENTEENDKAEMHRDILDYIKNCLADKVKEVRLSKKLTESPVCLAVDENDMDIRMERFLIEQQQLKSHTAKILEINPDHKIIKNIKEKINMKDEILQQENEDLINLLFDQACLLEGEKLTNPALYVKRLNKFISKLS